MTAASVEAYLTLVRQAYDGSLKLPEFQRDWKWRPQQVALMFDSLRQGFPVGSFLFMDPTSEIDFSPRTFRGAPEEAQSARTTQLVLDGQQRLTSGLELFHGTGPKHYFLDLKTIRKLSEEAGVDPSEKQSVKAFLSNLDVDDGYLKRLARSADPSQHLTSREYLWTGLLTDEDELTRALSILSRANPEHFDFYNFVIGRNFRASADTHIPITTIPGGVTVEAISRIFATLNSTGRILSPFELVVAVLFPHKVRLVEDIKVAKEAYPHYKRIDETGEIMLQTIALYANKDTRKASLPKNITPELYGEFMESVCADLERAAQFASDRLGVGLDSSDELLVYPVIYPPMASILRSIDERGLSADELGRAYRKIEEWYIGSILDRRYQQSTHDKQKNDKTDILNWALDANAAKPDWLEQTFVTGLTLAAPNSAKGKLLRSLLNKRNLRDPLTGELIGVGPKKVPSARHHIYATRWVHHLKGWDKSAHSNNTALNIMYLSESTNGRFLNCSPREQIEESIKIFGEAGTREIYLDHGINSTAFDIMRKPEPTYEDFRNFLLEREAAFASALEMYGFRRGGEEAMDEDEELADD